MSAAHTPGPWAFYTEPQPNGCPIVGTRGLMVAMLAHSINYDDQRETALANARLIAAAPRLLAALQMAKGLLEVNGFRAGPAMHVIDEAIIAATGSAA
jgi:hypothetical protein